MCEIPRPINNNKKKRGKERMKTKEKELGLLLEKVTHLYIFCFSLICLISIIMPTPICFLQPVLSQSICSLIFLLSI